MRQQEKGKGRSQVIAMCKALWAVAGPEARHEIREMMRRKSAAQAADKLVEKQLRDSS